ncbi:MAG: IS3 family transposase [Acidimicrobiales bacterium]
MSLASFVASQRTDHGVAHALACRALGVSESWFYKWRGRPPTARARRRAELDAKVRESFEGSDGTYGSPRVLADLREAGWRVSKKAVEASMARQGLVARTKRRRKNLTRPDKRAVPFPDLVRRDFTATAPDQRWVGDMTEIPTSEGRLYLATVEDLFSRRLPGFAMSEHLDAALARAAVHVAVAVRGGDVRDRASTPRLRRSTRARPSLSGPTSCCIGFHTRSATPRPPTIPPPPGNEKAPAAAALVDLPVIRNGTAERSAAYVAVVVLSRASVPRTRRSRALVVVQWVWVWVSWR